jgi:hypothetical protein
MAELLRLEQDSSQASPAFEPLAQSFELRSSPYKNYQKMKNFKKSIE